MSARSGRGRGAGRRPAPCSHREPIVDHTADSAARAAAHTARLLRGKGGGGVRGACGCSHLDILTVHVVDGGHGGAPRPRAAGWLRVTGVLAFAIVSAFVFGADRRHLRRGAGQAHGLQSACDYYGLLSGLRCLSRLIRGRGTRTEVVLSPEINTHMRTGRYLAENPKSRLGLPIFRLRGSSGH